MKKSNFVALILGLITVVFFGLVPYLCFMINPDLVILGMMSLFSLSMGACDYMNVYHALTQMPKGAYTYLSGFHSYWYLKEN